MILLVLVNTISAGSASSLMISAFLRRKEAPVAITGRSLNNRVFDTINYTLHAC